MASLSLTNVCKVYPNGFEAVKDFSLEVEDQEFIIFVGPSGCGKSTTLRMIAGLEEISSGELKIDGRVVNDVEPKDRDIAMVFQNYALYPHMTVFDNMAFGLKLRKVPKDEIKKKVEEAAKILDLEKLLDRKPKALSGGQRQRVGIARALILNPVFLVCDEPVSALDVSVQAQIVNLLKKIQRERKLASIFISHEINVVRYISDRIVVMYLGHIVEEAPKDELIHHPKHPYTKSLLASVPNMNPRERKRHVALEGEIPSPMDPPSGCVFHTRCPYATDKCRTEVPEYKESGDGHWVRCHEV